MNVATVDPAQADALALRLAEAACAAGAVLLAQHRGDGVRMKDDGTPVCAADVAADRAAKLALARLLPGLPVVSEETVAEGVPDGPFILLDPLDGTREFLAGGDSYCVAIACIDRDGRPLAGAIVAPASGRAWYAGRQAWARAVGPAGDWVSAPVPATVRGLPAQGPVALVSRFHGDARSDAIVDTFAPAERLGMSSAVKFGLIAEGSADINVRCGPTMAWDVAAGDAIVTAAGGALLSLDGSEIDYRAVGRAGWRNQPFVAASGLDIARRAVGTASVTAV